LSPSLPQPQTISSSVTSSASSSSARTHSQHHPGSAFCFPRVSSVSEMQHASVLAPPKEVCNSHNPRRPHTFASSSEVDSKLKAMQQKHDLELGTLQAVISAQQTQLDEKEQNIRILRADNEKLLAQRKPSNELDPTGIIAIHNANGDSKDYVKYEICRTRSHIKISFLNPNEFFCKYILFLTI
jgi:hypothetical protein